VHVLQYTAYRYRTQSGKHLAVRLSDTPGHGVTPCDLHYLMDGLVPENYQVRHSSIYLKTASIDIHVSTLKLPGQRFKFSPLHRLIVHVNVGENDLVCLM